MSRARWLFLLCLILGSCQLDRNLEVQDVALEQSYFVECYMRPGELFNLTATEISPIFEEYILDYSQDFDVYILNPDTIELFQSLFIEEGTGYIYNYGSGSRLSDQTGYVDLFVLSPMGGTITAHSRIPAQVKIDALEIVSEQITVTFSSSDDALDNFYILIANYAITGKKGKRINKNQVIYLDHHQLDEIQQIEVEMTADSLNYSEEVEVKLMRVTEENFQYQRSLEDAKNASQDNVTFPAPLDGNLVNAIGIFTCYTEDLKIIPITEIAQ